MPHRPARPRPPLTAKSLDELALSYVGRFATTRAKLTSYLARKLRERGWDGALPADPAALAERLAALGYIDDGAFAASKARSLASRGYGARRVAQALQFAGVDETDRVEAMDEARGGSVDAALLFARRRRIGPFAMEAPDPAQREKAIAAMLRAGHGFGLSRAIAALSPGAEIDIDTLREIR